MAHARPINALRPTIPVLFPVIWSSVCGLERVNSDERMGQANIKMLIPVQQSNVQILVVYNYLQRQSIHICHLRYYLMRSLGGFIIELPV
jgi:hypothetical protein